MNKTKISAEIVADSISPQGDRLISVLCTFPRIILSEVNTHRMLSKNTSSSRAIPFFRMVKSIVSNCFIPLAFQKYHSGMQGNTYLDVDKKYTFDEITDFLHSELVKSFKDDNGKWDKDYLEIDKALNLYVLPILTSSKEGLTLVEWWLKTRDLVVACAVLLYSFGVTKQLCNRLLEPFMWTTMLITGNRNHGGWDNFFKLRNPVYEYIEDGVKHTFNSKKDFIEYVPHAKDWDNLSFLLVNKGQAEIHIMDLAEKMWDAMNESTPKQLKEGEWHIPMRNKIDNDILLDILEDDNFIDDKIENYLVKISTAMAARTSYTVVGEEKDIDYSKMIELHDRLIAQSPPHSSPLEHCCLCVTENEYNNSFKGQEKGWFRNYKGFKSYRQVIEESK